MPDITPDLVAQVASRLYNALPGEQPLSGSASDSRSIASTLFDRAKQETSPFSTVPADTGSIPGSGDVLERISRAFESLKTGPATTATASPYAHDLLKSVNLQPSASLGQHADYLVHQQTYSDTNASHGNLKGFVKNIQSCRHDLLGSIDGEGNYADPFSRLLQASLPKSSRLSGLLSGSGSCLTASFKSDGLSL